MKGLLDNASFQRSLSEALPESMSPKRMVRVVLSSFQVNPKLYDCSPESVLVSMMRAAAMGLEPDGMLGQGYLVPYWNGKLKRLDCQFIPGYRGLVKLARNSGEVADVWARVVFEKDFFEYELGLDETLKHKPNDNVADPGEMLYAYAVARFKDGERKFEVMNRREILKIRDANPNTTTKEGVLYGPWKDHPGEMWKKTAVRRLAKLLPLSVEASERVEAEFRPESTFSAVVDTAEPRRLEENNEEMVDRVRGDREETVDVDFIRREFAKAKTMLQVDAIRKRLLEAAEELEHDDTREDFKIEVNESAKVAGENIK